MDGSVLTGPVGGEGPGGVRRGDPPLPAAARIDPADQIGFLRSHYLSAGGGFVQEGGAKIKLIIGPTGAGKTHFLADLAAVAQREGFLTASVDARVVPLWGFDLLYQALAADLDFAALARAFVGRLLTTRGYGDPHLRAGDTLSGWAAAQGHEAGRLRVALADALHATLCANPDLDYGYGLGLSRWCEATAWGAEPAEGAGWAPGAEQAVAGGLLEHWLRGGRVAVRDCNRLRLRRSADRFSAQFWLRSLLHFVRMAGFPGLVATVDGLDAVVAAPTRRSGPAGMSPLPEGTAAGPPGPVPGAWGPWASGGAAAFPHYTRQRRDDFYECLRAVIDDMGLLPGFLLALAGPPALVDPDNARTGFGSYPALAQRVQNEVETVELNRFADEIALERLWAADAEAGRALAEALVSAVSPGADATVRRRAVAAARAQWAVRDVDVSKVRRSVLAVLAAVGDTGTAGVLRGDESGVGGSAGPDGPPAGLEGGEADVR